jgi:hypothetical protein
MSKLLTTIAILCCACAANAETFVCTADSYIHTFEREGQVFLQETHIGNLSSEPYVSSYWNVELDTDSWLVLTQVTDDDLGVALIGTIINKETGKFVQDSVRSIEFEARKEQGNCVVGGFR